MKCSNSIAMAVLMALLVAGCAGTSGGVAPPINQQSIQTTDTDHHGARVLWGMVGVTIDPATAEAEIVPLREADFTCNITKFLQPPISPLNLLSISIDPGQSDFPSGYVVLYVQLSHPFPGIPLYRGFDVHGIVMGNGTNALVHDPAAIFADPGDLMLLNPDGYTRWWNPSEFGPNETIFGYQQGTFASNGFLPNATLNAYKYFADDLYNDNLNLDPANRGSFAASSVNKRKYNLQFPVPGGSPLFNFAYAIEANWAVPDPAYAPDYPVEAYPPEANAPEAYMVSVTDAGTDAYYVDDTDKGGSLRLKIEVFDWQAPYNPMGVPGELAGLWIEGECFASDFDVLASATVIDGGPTSSVFQVEISEPDLQLTKSGINEVMVIAESADPNTYEPQIDGSTSKWHWPDAPLAAYLRSSVDILDAPTTIPTLVDITPPQLSFELVEMWAEGDYLYVVSKSRIPFDYYTRGLHIFDVSNPMAPEWINWVELPDRSREVAIYQGMAYVAAYTDGLAIVDVDPPESAHLVKIVDLENVDPEQIFISDGYAYLGGNGLAIVDILPIGSEQLCSVLGDSDVNDIAVQGNYAYITIGDGTGVVDVSSPYLPVVVGYVPADYYAQCVALSGNYAYVTEVQGGFSVIDITDPTNAESVLKFGEGCNGHHYSIVVYGSRLYITDGPGGLDVYDISTPTSPAYLGSANIRTGNICRSGDKLYAGTIGFDDSGYPVTGGIGIIDLTGPVIPELIKKIEMPRKTVDIALQDGYACAIDEYGELHVIDVSTPEDAHYVSNTSLDSESYSVEMWDHYAITGSYTNMRVLDLAIPPQPGILCQIDLPMAFDVEVLEPYAYVVNQGFDGYCNFSVLDISDPGSTFIFSQTPVPYDIRAEINIVDSLAYVARYNSFDIIDISDPASPVSVKSLILGGYLTGMAVYGDYVYLVGDNLISIVDVSVPEDAAIIGSLSLIGGICDAEVIGDNLFMSGPTCYIASLLDPEAPEITGSYQFWVSSAGRVVIDDPYIYVAGGNTGLRIFKLQY